MLAVSAVLTLGPLVACLWSATRGFFFARLLKNVVEQFARCTGFKSRVPHNALCKDASFRGAKDDFDPSLCQGVTGAELVRIAARLKIPALG
jgi:hypothetical protein